MSRFRSFQFLTEVEGYAMAALFVGLAIMGILMSIVLPVWSQVAKREREVELVFRGEQYSRSIELYQRKNLGQLPVDFQDLVDRRFLRKLYKDPMTNEGEFQILYEREGSGLVGLSEAASSRSRASSQSRQGGIIGVASKSTEESLKVYNDGMRYNEWRFVYSSLTDETSSGIEDLESEAGEGFSSALDFLRQ